MIRIRASNSEDRGVFIRLLELAGAFHQVASALVDNGFVTVVTYHSSISGFVSSAIPVERTWSLCSMKLI